MGFRVQGFGVRCVFGSQREGFRVQGLEFGA